MLDRSWYGRKMCVLTDNPPTVIAVYDTPHIYITQEKEYG